MTLVVEDGTGLANAESYVSVADCTDYHSKRDNAAWAATAASPATVRENLLRRATEYLDSIYGERWQGEQVNPSVQALNWPRQYVYVENNTIELSSTSLPVALVRATCEVALLLAEGEDLLPALERGGRIKALTQVVGPLSERTAYADDAPSTTVYHSVDRYVKPLLRNSAIMGTVTRG